MVFPTDTLYGLLANAFDPEAVKKVFELKNRSWYNPIPVFVSDIEKAKEIAYINFRQEKFLSQVWPGKVSAVLKVKKDFPEEITKEGKLAIRIPNYSYVEELFKFIDFPLTGTSANLSGGSFPTNFQEVASQINADVAVDAGVLPTSKPSTVVDISERKKVVVRKGAVPKEELPEYPS